MGPLITLVAGISDLGLPLLFVLGVVVGAGVVLVIPWLRAERRWRNAGGGIRRAGYVLSTTLSAIQAVAVTIAALLAVDFFLLGPTLTETPAFAQRVDRMTVENMYFASVPDVVKQTLTELDDRSFPLTTGATITTGGGLSLKVGQQSVPGAQSVATSIVEAQYPINKLCAGSGAGMVEALFSGACTGNAQFPIPFYDRVLLSLNEQAAASTGPQPAMPLDNDHLREGANILTKAVRLRATVTLSNTGRSTAQNVSVTPADQYTVTTKPPQTSIPPGASLSYVFDGPGATADQSADPTFPFKADPTGPVDPAILSVAVGVGAFVIVATLLRAIAGADRPNQAQGVGA